MSADLEIIQPKAFKEIVFANVILLNELKKSWHLGGCFYIYYIQCSM